MLLNKNVVIKKLTIAKKKNSGRNNYGHIVIVGRGGGAKKRYRFVDFFRRVRNIFGCLLRVEVDPNRSSFLGLVLYRNSILSYILVHEGFKLGEFIFSSNKVLIKNGNACMLKYMKTGSLIFNLEIYPNSGGKISRSAGTYCQVLKRLNDFYVLLKLRSKEYRMFHCNNFCTSGISSNKFKKFQRLLKAGDSRRRGIRPIVRGEAKNPVDHPHGGNTSGGRFPKTRTGLLAKGVRTGSGNALKFVFRSRFKNKNV